MSEVAVSANPSLPQCAACKSSVMLLKYDINDTLKYDKNKNIKCIHILFSYSSYISLELQIHYCIYPSHI